MTTITVDLVKNGEVQTTLKLFKDDGSWIDIDPENTKLSTSEGSITETPTQFRCFSDSNEIVRLQSFDWNVYEGESRGASCKSCKPGCHDDPDWICTRRE